MDNIRDKIVECLDLLTKAVKTRLSSQQLQQADAHYYDLAQLIIDNNQQIPRAILNIVREAATHDVFVYWASAMAHFARENNEQKYLEYGIVALALSNRCGDFREEFISICLLYNTSLSIGCNFENMTLRLQPIFPKEFARAAHRFITLDPSDKSLDAIGYCEVKTSKGTTYGRRR